MRKSCIVSTAALILVISGAALTHAGPPKKATSVEGITEYQLDNGARVLLFPDDSKPTVTVNMTVFVGSRHEGYGETGMAHLLEHMVFKGTPTHQQIPRLLKDRGATFNGTTWLDRTNYFETLPASDENLEFAIHLEADRLVNSYVRRDDLLSEMTVVRNEFERNENNPAGILSQRMMSVAFEWHNYGKTTIGNRSDIERVPIDALKEFYKKFYQPDNVLLIIAGKFDEKKALGYVQKHLGSIPRPKRVLPNTYTEEPAQDGERTVVLRRVGDVGNVGVLYHVPSGPHQDYPAIAIMSDLLTSAPSGRLYKALVETKKATGLQGGAMPTHDPGVVRFGASVSKDGSLEEVRDILIEYLETLATKEITSEEVERSKRKMLKQWELSFANSGALAVQLSEWAAQGDWRLFFLHRDRLEKVTPEDVQSVAGKYFHGSNRTVGMFIPTEKPQRVAIPATPELKTLVGTYKGRKAIAQGETFDPTPANIEARTTRIEIVPGVKAALLPKKTRGNTVNLQLRLRYGNEDSLKGLQTAAGVLPSMMMRGTKKYSYQQLRDELDKQKAQMGPPRQSPLGVFGMNIQTKRENLPGVIRILHQVLREPSLPVEEFEIIKRQMLSMMERQKSEPMALGPNLMQRTISPYPADNVRYVPTIEEQIERIRSLMIDQVRLVYEEFLSAQAGEIAIVGDFDPDACIPLLRSALEGWQSRQPYERIASSIPPGLKGDLKTIVTPDKANAVYIAATLFPINQAHDDYPALTLGNFILGGGSLSSRLADRVRQKEGLSYSIQSMFSSPMIDERSALNIFAISNPNNTPKVVSAIREELDKFLKDGVTAEELEEAKRGYQRARNRSRASDGAVAGMLNSTSYYGLAMDHYSTMEAKIATVSKEQILAAWKRHFNPDDLIIVTAGDFEATAGK